MKERPRLISTIALGLMLLALGLGIGQTIGGEREKITPIIPEAQGQQTPGLTAQEMSNPVPKETRKVTAVYRFACGHDVSRDISTIAQGMDTAALAAAYGAHSCNEIAGTLTLYIAMGSACPEHFWIDEDADSAAVFKTDAESLERIKVCELGGDWKRYGGADMPAYFGSLEEINLYLEGIDE